MTRRDRISVLLLDDNADLAHLYKQQLERSGPFDVSMETDGVRARRLAERQLFDVVVVDAKLDYRGVEFGGLRLADDLRTRYGTSAILVISRFITSDLMQEHGHDYDFMEKTNDIHAISFGRHLSQRIRLMRRRQYVFVAMPFSADIASLYHSWVKPAVKVAGFKCLRVDEVAHGRTIQQTLFELIESSKMVVFIADGGNANAYYEAGFADAMRKEVIVVASTVKELKFDVANRHTITYGTRPSSLLSSLRSKIHLLRLSRPVSL